MEDLWMAFVYSVAIVMSIVSGLAGRKILRLEKELERWQRISGFIPVSEYAGKPCPEMEIGSIDGHLAVSGTIPACANCRDEKWITGDLHCARIPCPDCNLKGELP